MIYEFSGIVPNSPGLVFALIADVDRKHEWVSEVISSRITSDGPVGAGTTFEDEVRFMGRTSRVNTVFTEYDPDKKVAYRHLDGPIKADLEYTMSGVESGTQLDIRIDVKLPWILRPVSPLVKRIMGRQMDGNFAALLRAINSE